jgi:hypothetical protein
VFGLHSHLFQTQIELPEGNKALRRNVSWWMDTLQVVSKTHGRISGVNSPREKNEKYSYKYMFRNVVKVQPNNEWTSVLEIFIFGDTKKNSVFSYT